MRNGQISRSDQSIRAYAVSIDGETTYTVTTKTSASALQMFIALFLLDILALIGVLGSPAVLFISIFFNDSPNANSALVAYLQMVFWLFPLTAGLGGVMGLVASKTRNIRRMAIWTLVAYSSPIGLGLLVLIAFVNGL